MQEPPLPSLPVAQLRKNYERDHLDEANAPGEPLELFDHWLAQAQAEQVPEPTAMTLATVGEDARPSTRIVLLKGYDPAGLVWFTNYRSRKGRELAHHPAAALQFHWVQLERMVRIEGHVDPVDRAESETYFRTRPLASRWAAWASAQSEVVASRAELEQAMANAQATYGDDPPCPVHWGGYRLRPSSWEFWQGRPSRLHDRLRYRLDPSHPGWLRERLAP